MCILACIVCSGLLRSGCGFSLLLLVVILTVSNPSKNFVGLGCLVVRDVDV